MLPCRGPVTLAPGVMTTGEVPRMEALETVEGFWTMKNDQYTPDAMPDDQSLAIHLPGKGLVVISGCAHSGIINIINRAEDILGRAPDYVFAGFHLYNPSLGQSEPRALVDAVGERLRARKATRYVTGHCTGDDAYAWLHETLGDRLAYMATGTTFTI